MLPPLETCVLTRVARLTYPQAWGRKGLARRPHWDAMPRSREPARKKPRPKKGAPADAGRPPDSFRSLVEGIRDYAVTLLDTEGRIVTWNEGARRLTGFGADEAIGEPVSLFYPADDVATGRPERELERARRDGRAEDESWRVRKDGSRYWANTVITALTDASGALTGYARVTRDLTARQRGEAFLQSLLDHTLDGILTIDERGTIESMNRSAERMFGYTEEEVVGRNVTMLMPSSFRGAHEESLERYLRTGETRVIGVGREVRGLRRDGSEFSIDIAVTEFRFEGKRHFAGLVRDITDRKRLEQQLQQSQKMEAIGQLAGGIAHDFNNILMVIQGHCHMLLGSVAPEDPRRISVSEIRKASERAAGLTRQLLAYSRRQVMEMRSVDLNVVVTEVEGMLRRLIGEDIHLAKNLDPGLAPVRIDTGQMEQVLLNLALNARDAMPRGGRLTLETRNVRLGADYLVRHGEERSGPHVLLAVTDTGIGMDEATRQRIFDPFFTTKGPGKGTGLGLAMVYGIVRQFAGAIEVYSELGHGTSFKVYLPVDEESAGARAAGTSTHHGLDGDEIILLVEDEDAVRAVTTLALRSHGYEVLAAASAREALRLLDERAGAVDLLLTDVVMPEMSGRELVDRVRPHYPGLRVIYMSGYTDDAVVRHGLVGSEAAFVSKPCTPSELTRKVREVLDRT